MAGGEENKVYVGNLSYGTTDETLREHFQSIGEISDGKKGRLRYKIEVYVDAFLSTPMDHLLMCLCRDGQI